MENSSFIDKFSSFAVKLGNQIHLRSLRDAFSVTMPLFILAGVATLVNNVVFTEIFSGETLETAQYWGTTISNATLNISGLLIAPMIAYFLSKNREFDNPIAAVCVSISALVIMMPNAISVTPTGLDSPVSITGVLSYSNLGTTGMFAGIIIGLLATEAFIFFSSIKRLKINLGENVPPAVANSFNVLMPVMIVLSLFGLVSLGLYAFFDTDLISLISTVIQEPLKKINTSLIGCVFIYSFGNFLFTLGIHQTVVNGVILEPLLLANMNENTLAYANKESAPNIITSSFVNTFGMIGGTGSTIALIIATLLFSKMKSTKSVAKLAAAPGLFNINEPIIFGYPIVFNLPMMIPFVLLPAIGIIIAYFATAIGFMSRTVVYTPWTSPPIISAYLATGGDIKAVVVQLIIIIVGVLLYLPFMKIYESISMKNSEA